MAKITTKGGPFTGHIGPVGFIKGEGETEVPTAVAYFRRHPDRYDVTEDAQDPPAEQQPEKPKRTRSRKPRQDAPEAPAPAEDDNDQE